MTYEIINREQVGEDLFEGAFYYAQISLELSDRFLDEFHTARKIHRGIPIFQRCDVWRQRSAAPSETVSLPYSLHHQRG